MINNRSFTIVLLLCGLTCLLGIFMIPLMDIDAAQYASISREMLQNKSYLQVFDLGKDYLDKPPMLFWLSATSMRFFGVHDWAYRLPSFLFIILAVLSTYQLALLFYRKEIAKLSAMVLASCQAVFLITHDVRCDTMLMGWVALSLWQLAAWYQGKGWKYFLVGFMAIAGGMMTKGPIALLVPAFAFVPHFLLRRDWRQFYRWEYLLGICIIGILLVPMSLGLYWQYDMHPGKLINNVPIQSGLRFYYWTQSFGRYTGENVYHEMSYFSFLLENMLWSFLPWILFFLIGLVVYVRELFTRKFRLAVNEEFICAGGFILTYCVLARSQAQLPHYIFVVFPLAAVVTARFLFTLLYTSDWRKWQRPLLSLHALLFSVLWLAVVALMIWPFENIPKYVAAVAGLCFIVFLELLFSKKLHFPALLATSFFTVIGVNVFLNTAFYPNLLTYQMGNDAATFINQQQLPKDKISTYGVQSSRTLHFYGQFIFADKQQLGDYGPPEIVITDKDSLPVFEKNFPKLKVLHEGNNFGVSMLSFPFLNPATRDKEVPKYLILDLDGKP